MHRDEFRSPTRTPFTKHETSQEPEQITNPTTKSQSVALSEAPSSEAEHRSHPLASRMPPQPNPAAATPAAAIQQYGGFYPAASNLALPYQARFWTPMPQQLQQHSDESADAHFSRTYFQQNAMPQMYSGSHLMMPGHLQMMNELHFANMSSQLQMGFGGSSVRLAPVSADDHNALSGVRTESRPPQRKPVPRKSSSMTTPAHRRPESIDEMDAQRSTSPDHEAPARQVSTTKRQRRTKKAGSDDEAEGEGLNGLGGEQRLTIMFSSLGTAGEVPQTFGKNGALLPDGLCGSHRMYSQEWEFRIDHVKIPDPENQADLMTVVSWTVTNVTSGTTVRMQETPWQAHFRQVRGNTVSNLIVRQALESRIGELHVEAQNRSLSVLQRAHIMGLIEELNPKKCSQGLLFFGLRHRCVQEAARASLAASKAPTPST